MRYLLMLVLVAAPAGAFQVTPQARIFVDAFDAAARALGYQRKQIAAAQELNEKQWKRQIAAEEGQHVSAYRMALAPPDVIREWIKRIAPAFGLRVFDRHDDIVKLIDANVAQAAAYQQLMSEQERRRA